MLEIAQKAHKTKKIEEFQLQRMWTYKRHLDSHYNRLVWWTHISLNSNLVLRPYVSFKIGYWRGRWIGLIIGNNIGWRPL